MGEHVLMKKKIVWLERVEYDGYDEKEQEDVEDRYTVGYFSCEEYVKRAKCFFEARGVPATEWKETAFEMDIHGNQRYLYVLRYDYYKFIPPDEKDYDNYYYTFPPQTSVTACRKMKAELRKNPKFRHRPDRIYIFSNDGFFIEKDKIDFVYYDVNKDIGAL